LRTPRPLAGFKGPTSKVEDGRGKDGRGRKEVKRGRDRRGNGRGL